MNTLNYIAKTNGLHTAVLPSFFGNFVVNITQTQCGFRLLVSVPPEKYTLCCPVVYCLDGWENKPTLASAKQAAHDFIQRKRLERIEQYRTRLYKPYKPTTKALQATQSLT